MDLARPIQQTIQILPEDVLILIFLYSGLNPIQTDTPDIRSVSPMNIALVCRSWRAAVAAQPNLWGRFQVDISTRKPVNSRLAQLVETWLQNSLATLLHFRVFILVESAPYWHDPTLESIASQLLSQAHRWRDVELFFHSNIFMSLPAVIQLPSMRSLRSLRLGLAKTYESIFWLHHDRRTVTLDMSCCHELETLTLRSGVSLRLVGRQSLCLHHLNMLELTVDAPNFEDFRRILEASTNLVCLKATLIGTSTFSSDTSPEGSISLTKLSQVSLLNDNPQLVIQLLDWLTCPNLQDFSSENMFSNSVDVPVGLLIAFDNFFHRSRPPLTLLDLEYGSRRTTLPSSSDPQRCSILRRILGRLGGLRFLGLKGFAIDDRLFQKMTIGEGESRVTCPLLEVVHVECYLGDITAPTVADLIVSRWRSGRLLRHLTLDVGVIDFITMVLEYSEVKQCVEEGFGLYGR